MYSKFLGPLPSTAEEYVSSIPKYFPYLIDTKILLNANSIFQEMKRKSSTSLAKAFAFLCPEIASGVKTSRLVYKSCVEVEVQVDEMRFDFLCVSLGFLNLSSSLLLLHHLCLISFCLVLFMCCCKLEW